jgi:hypothetical protein
MAFARATATIQSPIRCAGAGKKTVKVNSSSLWRPVQVAGADSLTSRFVPCRVILDGDLCSQCVKFVITCFALEEGGGGGWTLILGMKV